MHKLRHRDVGTGRVQGCERPTDPQAQHPIGASGLAWAEDNPDCARGAGIGAYFPVVDPSPEPLNPKPQQ